MTRGFRIVHALSGWIVLYLAVGGCIGMLIRQPYQAAPSCFPATSIFGVIQSSCPYEAVNVFWFVIAGLPRLLIICPALVFALLKAAISSGVWRWALGAAMWLLYSIPLLLLD
jgi:hypothetical protein